MAVADNSRQPHWPHPATLTLTRPPACWYVGFMPLYFAYGANMSTLAMRHRCPEGQAVGPAMLEGFRFFVGREGWGSVRPSPGDNVHGVLWRLTPRDLAALHAYEALHKGLYELRRLPVLREGHRLPALIYLLRSRVPGRPRPGYIRSIAAAARGWALPEHYIRGVERWSPSGFIGAPGIDVGEAT